MIDGHLIWVILVSLAVAYIVAVQWLPEKAAGKLKEDETCRYIRAGVRNNED